MINALGSEVGMALLDNKALSADQWQQLIHWELADQRRANAWGIDQENVIPRLEERAHWLRRLAPLHANLPLPPRAMIDYFPLYWQLWLPLAQTLKAARDQAHRPLVQGILGVQGTGKTTLTLILQAVLGAMGYRTAGLSIDDLYKTYRDRLRLRQEDPRLLWRGPPGTHDVDLGIATLDQIRGATPETVIPLPRFDKSCHGGEGDRTTPEPVQGVDILLFEGWFMGMRPLDPTLLDQAPAPICTEADRQFARDMNERLASYLPLWDRLDRLMVLCPDDYRISKQWRRQAEHQMKAQGKTGMDDATLDAFVDYFWRSLHPELFLSALKSDRDHVDLVVEINRDRFPCAIYRPD
jgi:D-glycerate 3-kinase